MVLDKQEFGAGSCTEWHSCPCCGKVRLTSHPEAHIDDDHARTYHPATGHAVGRDLISTTTSFLRKGAPNLV